METLTLNLACGPDERMCVLELTFAPDQDDFVDCTVRMQLPHQLDLRLSGLLFYSNDFQRLRDAFEADGTALGCSVVDSDGLLTISAVKLPGWVEWSFEWQGIYPAFQPFTPDAPPKSKIVIRGLRTHWIQH